MFDRIIGFFEKLLEPSTKARTGKKLIELRNQEESRRDRIQAYRTVQSTFDDYRNFCGEVILTIIDDDNVVELRNRLHESLLSFKGACEVPDIYGDPVLKKQIEALNKFNGSLDNCMICCVSKYRGFFVHP